MLASIETYLQDFNPDRRDCASRLFHWLEEYFPNISPSMRFNMPTFDSDKGWIAIGNDQYFTCIYFSQQNLIAEFAHHHPQIMVEKTCIKFQAKDAIPLAEIQKMIIQTLHGDTIATRH